MTNEPVAELIAGEKKVVLARRADPVKALDKLIGRSIIDTIRPRSRVWHKNTITAEALYAVLAVYAFARRSKTLKGV